MNIQWNAVTWYSKLAASVIFVLAFFLAFNLGIVWEQVHIETAILQTPSPTASSTSQAGQDVTLPSTCGGFIKDAPVCPKGYRCQLNLIADTGGKCVVDTASPVPSDMLVVTARDENTTIKLAKNQRFAVKFGDLSWTLSFAPDGAITRVPNTIATDGYQGVYEANRAGTVTLSANGQPICKLHEACPQYIQQIQITFVVGN